MYDRFVNYKNKFERSRTTSSNATNPNCDETFVHVQCTRMRIAIREELFGAHVNVETKPMQFLAKLPRIRQKGPAKKDGSNFPSKFPINIWVCGMWYLLAFSQSDCSTVTSIGGLRHPFSG